MGLTVQDVKALICAVLHDLVDVAVIRGVRNSKESRTLARESILESQIRIKNH